MVEKVERAKILVRSEQPRKVFELYELMRINCREETIAAFPELVSIWQEYIGLMYQGMIGEHSYEVDTHRQIAARFLLVSMNTSATVLNCCLDGWNIQGLALTRHLLDSWQKVAYSKLHPETAAKWLSVEGQPPSPPGQNTILKQLLKSRHKENAMVVERMYKSLNNFAHASSKMLAAHDTDRSDQLQLGPSFHAQHTLELFGQALPATALLVAEMANVFDVADDWAERTRILNLRLADALSGK